VTFTVRELRKAKADKRAIFTWLHERSPQGAFAWLAGYDEMLERVATSDDSLAAAHEHRDLEMDVKQTLFKTRRGCVSRALLIIEGHEVFILRVRGPGQATVDADDLETP